MSDGHEELTQSSALQRIISEDAVGKLRRREGQMATLGSENGDLKLDWVEGIARLLQDQTKLEIVEDEARQLWQQGIRHLIWAGMGGSVITVRVMSELGFCHGADDQGITIYPLDSTDPAALNGIVRQIAQAKQMSLPAKGMESDKIWLQAFLKDVMMVGVAMGMTSEEPITHLTWFAELLEQAGLSPAEHLFVMTLPGSYLDRFAKERNAPSRSLQLDGGNGTGGRMSAPTTRVFLLPAALYLMRQSNERGLLRKTLTRAWQDYDLYLATAQPARHEFVRLAARLAEVSENGACRMLLQFPHFWQPLVMWIEQLMEESLGKNGKGVVAFYDQPLSQQALEVKGIMRVIVSPKKHDAQTSASTFTLSQPSIGATDGAERLAALATSFLGWQLCMALYGYLQDITFAGQPAVENYKARARELRVLNDPLQATTAWKGVATSGRLTLFAPQNAPLQQEPTEVFAQALQQARSSELAYLDVTVNGEIPSSLWNHLSSYIHTLGNEKLDVPIKLRRAPADYHSTEQSEMDGPPSFVSLRLLVRNHEQMLLGNYNDTFLIAQAVSTWQAVVEQGRKCFLLVIDGNAEQAEQPLTSFFQKIMSTLGK